MGGTILGHYQLKKRRITKMMSRKDYNATAEIIKNFWDKVDNQRELYLTINDLIHTELIQKFSNMFEDDNPNFNPDIFWEKCTR